MSGSGCSRGTQAWMAKKVSIPVTPTTTKAMRQVKVLLMKVPMGTPTSVATVMPAIM